MIRTQPDATEVRGIVLPVGAADLLLPSAAVAEIVRYRDPTPFSSAPQWLLGAVTWRDHAVPLVSVAAQGGEPGAITPGLRARMVVCFTPNGNPKLPYVGILAVGVPRLARFRTEALVPTETVPENLFVLHALTFADRPAWIPDMHAIERSVLKALQA
ncbi:MAG: chemotaxis protein CheW [Pseudomonadota bacterium]|nr:chemotaxis protein CheW [Pseudomonadota bacterium]